MYSYLYLCCLGTSEVDLYGSDNTESYEAEVLTGPLAIQFCNWDLQFIASAASAPYILCKQGSWS